MDRLPAKRKLIVGLTIFIFTISLISLMSRLVPMSSWHGEMTQDASRNEPNSGSSLADDDGPEPEDLVEVHTKPTSADAWQPKTLEKPSANVLAAVKSNILQAGKDRILLTAVANSGMADYTLNWIESLKQCKLSDKFLVFAIDEKLVETMTTHGYGDHVVSIPQDWYHQNISSTFAKWQQKTYMPITHSKSLVVERLLYLDVTVWFSDVDIVFRSPTIYSYLLEKLRARKSRTEVLFSQETEQNIVNSGFYIMRPTLTNKRILADSIVIQDNEPQVTQQRAINRVLDDMNLSYQTSAVALLDLALFPQGRMFFERNIPRKFGFEPMIVHANYRVGDEKKKSLQQAGLWFIDQD